MHYFSLTSKWSVLHLGFSYLYRLIWQVPSTWCLWPPNFKKSNIYILRFWEYRFEFIITYPCSCEVIRHWLSFRPLSVWTVDCFLSETLPSIAPSWSLWNTTYELKYRKCILEYFATTIILHITVVVEHFLTLSRLQNFVQTNKHIPIKSIIPNCISTMIFPKICPD